MRWLGLTVSAGVFCILGCGGDWGSVVPSYDGYDAKLEAYKGRNINEVVLERGAPARTVDLAEGSKAYIWEQRSRARTPTVERTVTNRQTGQKSVVTEGGSRVPFDCVTELHADSDGIIYGHRSKGMACLGTTPDASEPDASDPSATPSAPGSASPSPAAETPSPTPEGDAEPEDGPSASAAGDEATGETDTRRSRRKRKQADRQKRSE